MNYDYKRLTPFKWFVLQNFPYIDEDFDAITNYQLFCKLGEEINKVIKSQNLVGEQVEQLTNAFNELQTYVTNYLDNLDIYQDVSDKLDEMATDGTLSNLINQELFGELNNKITNLENDMNNKINTKDFKLIIPKYTISENIITTLGDCFIYKIDGKVLMIDCGLNNEDFYQNIKDALDNNNITKIDYLLITHYHGDHYQNLENLLEDYDFSDCEIILPRISQSASFGSQCQTAYNTIKTWLDSADITNYRFSLNETLEIGRATLKIFNASAEDLAYYDDIGETDYNAYSIVSVLNYNGQTIFNSADMTSDTVDRILTQNYFAEKVNIYKSAHHGYNALSIKFKNYLSILSPDFMIATMPNYWFRTDGLSAGSQNGQPIYAKSQGIPYYVMGYQKEGMDIIINEQNTNFEIITPNIPLLNYTNKGIANMYSPVYIDNSIEDYEYSDGTQAHPFKYIEEAICYCFNNPGKTILLEFLSSTYNSHVKLLDDNLLIRIIAPNNELTFTDDVEFDGINYENDTIEFTFEKQLIVRNSHIKAKIVNLTYSTSPATQVINSSCVITTLNLTNSRVVISDNSLCRVSTCNINNQTTLRPFYINKSFATFGTIAGSGNTQPLIEVVGSFVTYNTATVTSTATNRFLLTQGGYFSNASSNIE